MSNAALELLKKGGNNAPPDKETTMSKTAAEEPQVEEETAEIEIDDLKTHADIDKLVSDYDLEVPENWAKLTKEDKKKYLKDNYDDSEDDVSNVPHAKAPAEPEATTADDQDQSDTEQLSEDVADEGAAESLKASLEAAKTDAKPAKTTKAKPAAKKTEATGDAVGKLDYAAMVAEIEKMDKSTALTTASVLHEQTNVAMFRLGGVLALIQENGWFEPYGSFQEYVEQQHGLNRRRALYWVSIYKNVVNSGISFDKLVHIPWSKLKEIVALLNDENVDVDAWIKLAEDNTVNDLIEHVRAYKNKIAGNTGSDTEEVKKTTTKSFKLYPDQVETVDAALEKVKEDSDIADNHVALEHLALAYLGTPNKKMVPNPLDFTGLDFEKVITAVADQFPDHDISVD